MIYDIFSCFIDPSFHQRARSPSPETTSPRKDTEHHSRESHRRSSRHLSAKGKYVQYEGRNFNPCIPKFIKWTSNSKSGQNHCSKQGSQSKIKTEWKTADPDETAHYEPSHRDLQFEKKIVLVQKKKKKIG